MRKIFFICTFLVVSLFAFSQAEKINSDSCYAVKEKDTTWQIKCVQKMPEFPDGESGMFKFIGLNTKYPNHAKELGIQGKVFITFVIDKSGEVVDIELYKGITVSKDVLEKYSGDENGLSKYKDAADELSKESLRVISLMPRWKPGMEDGKPVKVRFILPFNFKLT